MVSAPVLSFHSWHGEPLVLGCEFLLSFISYGALHFYYLLEPKLPAVSTCFQFSNQQTPPTALFFFSIFHPKNVHFVFEGDFYSPISFILFQLKFIWEMGMNFSHVDLILFIQW